MDTMNEFDPSASGRINETSVSREPGLHTWLVGALAIARYHGIDLDPTTFRIDPTTPVP
jgi:hypothetical protein